ncbi:hypothetical protein JL720_11576 [Aureococcus anophagefferens]|nr:hypothetical protein JL720_11576 [Aureococcus anophagefferens]
MRVVLAVSGTLQEGFPLRKNLDAPGAPAVHLGSGLVRCVKSYLDTKEPGCREHGNDPNPCCVVTGDPADANVYELYLVDGEACVAALLGEPRYLAMAPDAVTLDLEAAETSGVVRAFARECLGDVARCSVLAVVSAVRAPPSFVATPTAGGPTDFASTSSTPTAGAWRSTTTKGRSRRDAAWDNAARLLAAARRGGLTVAHSRSHRYGARIHRDLVGSGDAGYALDAAVAARPGEIVVDKWTFGAFASTDLEARLRRRGVTRILLCGVLTNVCVMATAARPAHRLPRVPRRGRDGAFDAGWHESAVGLINGPQVAAGHARAPAATGLYFGEKTTVANVEAALAGL